MIFTEKNAKYVPRRESFCAKNSGKCGKKCRRDRKNIQTHPGTLLKAKRQPQVRFSAWKQEIHQENRETHLAPEINTSKNRFRLNQATSNTGIYTTDKSHIGNQLFNHLLYVNLATALAHSLFPVLSVVQVGIEQYNSILHGAASSGCLQPGPSLGTTHCSLGYNPYLEPLQASTQPDIVSSMATTTPTVTVYPSSSTVSPM